MDRRSRPPSHHRRPQRPTNGGNGGWLDQAMAGNGWWIAAATNPPVRLRVDIFFFLAGCRRPSRICSPEKFWKFFLLTLLVLLKHPIEQKTIDFFFLCMSDAFESVWGVVKAPYVVDDEGYGDYEHQDFLRVYTPHEEMYQGGKKGDPDTGFWHGDLEAAIAYALFGSQIFDDETGGAMAMREGEPQLRVAPKTDKTYFLTEDYMDSPGLAGHTKIGNVSHSPGSIYASDYPNLPNKIMDSAKLWEKINEMAASDRDIGYGSSALEHPTSSVLAHIDKLRRRYAP